MWGLIFLNSLLYLRFFVHLYPSNCPEIRRFSNLIGMATAAGLPVTFVEEVKLGCQVEVFVGIMVLTILAATIFNLAVNDSVFVFDLLEVGWSRISCGLRRDVVGIVESGNGIVILILIAACKELECTKRNREPNTMYER
jgi:hypothetical protein